MGITDRIARIVKSYANSAADTFTDEFQNLSRKYESGELSDHLKQKFEDLKAELAARTDPDQKHSEEELDDYLKQEFARARQRTSQGRTSQKKSAYHAACKRLGVSPEADLKDIEKAYKKEMRQFHPDRFAGDPSRVEHATKVTQMLTEAWQTIKSARKG